MHANLKHAQRGQAVVETVLFLPMFLLALFGIIWTVKLAVQYERVESAVRYAGLISQRANPFADYSFYSMYSQLGSRVMPSSTSICNPLVPLTAALTDAAPTYASSRTPSNSTPFWTPQGVAPSCSAGLIGIPAGTGLAQDVILSQQNPGMTSTVQVPSALVSTLGTLTSTQASEHFFRPVGENVIMACYPTLNAQVTSSLEYQTDTSSAVLPVALGTVLSPTALTADPTCTTL